jgi:hypothetical protein
MYVVNFAANGCIALKAITVNAAPAITGNCLLCKNLTTSLSCAAAGTWTSNHPEIASINSSGVVFGVVPGTAIISYTISEGCKIGRMATVDTVTYPLQTSPVYTPALHDICIGSVLQMHPVPGANGTWVSSNASVASVTTAVSPSPDGVVTALATGTTTITYTGPNGCRVYYNYTVHTMPVITSSPVTVCKYAFAGPFTGSPTGGEWFATTTSSAPILGINISTSIAQGLNAGTSLITYRMYHYGGCTATLGATVNPCGAKESGEENGAMEENMAKGYSIYPNPGYSDFTITQNIPEDGVNDLQVVNYMGQSIYQSNITFKGGTGSLSLPNVPPGIYIIAIADKAREKSIMHLVVQR